jgi:uncharacterized protein (DUF302 family)
MTRPGPCMIAVFISLLLLSAGARAGEGLLSVKSSHDAGTTAQRFADKITARGMKVFCRISHSDEAAKVDLALRPTEVIIFGNPRVGTLLMQCSQSVAIDLPLKALIWEDENGNVWLSYNDMEYLKERHHITGCDETISKIAKALAGAAGEAATLSQADH